MGQIYVKGILNVALPKYLIVIIRMCQMCIQHARQQFEHFMYPFFITLYCVADIF
jgi:hypothetical protein